MNRCSVEASIQFLALCKRKPIFHGYRKDLDYLPLEDRRVRIEDIRGSASACSLDREGFALIPHRTSVKDFFDQNEVQHVYQRESEELLMQVTGAVKVIASIGCVIRRSERSPGFGKDRTSILGRFAHCDFSPNPAGSSFWVRKMLAHDEAGERLGRRFAIYNIWRVLSDPPQDTPLAVCDTRSVAPSDRVCADCVVDGNDGPDLRFENTIFRHSSGQRWCYFSNMTRDEALIFKGFDSDPERAGGVPHAAFDDPSCPPGSSPRESIDMRFIAFFE